MPLQEQYMEVGFPGGLDTKSDPNVVIPGNYINLVNTVYTKTGSLRKRPGNNRLSTAISTGGNIPSARSVAGYEQNLLMFGNDQVFALNEANTAWTLKDNVPEPTITGNVLSSTTVNVSQSSAAYANNINVVLYGNGSLYYLANNQIFVTVVDDSGVIYFNNYILNITANCANPVVVTVGNLAIAMYQNGTNVIARTLDLTNPVAWSAETTIATDAQSSFDAVGLTTRFVLTYLTTVANTARVIAYNTSLGVINTHLFTTSALLFTIAGNETSGQLWVACATSVFVSPVVVQAIAFSVSTLAITTPIFTVFTSANTHEAVARLGIALLPNNIDAVVVASPEFFNFSPQDTGIWKQNVLASGGPLAGNRFVTYSYLTIISKPFTVGTKTYIAVQDVIDETNFIADIWSEDVTTTAGYNHFMRPVATFADYIAYTPNTPVSFLISDYLSHIPQNAAGQWIVPALITNQQTISLVAYAVTFGTSFQFAQVNQTLCTSGGVPSSFDGNRLSEIDFCVRPIVPATATAVTGTGTLPAGTYFYQVCYEWSDAKGQLYQSAPSNVISGTLSATGEIQFTISYCTFTTKQMALIPPLVAPDAIRVIVYRSTPTASAPTTYKRLTPQDLLTNAPLNINLNNTGTGGQAYFTFTDSGVAANETALLTNPLLYTYVELKNDHPPTATFTVVQNGRMWLAGLDDNTQIWVSKSIEELEPPKFSRSFAFNIHEGGAITGIGALDDKLVVFKRNSIFIVYGQGPTDLGTGGDFVVQRISSDTGCTDGRSVVVTRDGLMFMAPIGLSLLSRSLQMSYIGAPVEGITQLFNQGVSGAINHPTNPWVLFGLGPDSSGNGVTILYDYFQQKWSTWQWLDFPNSVNAFPQSMTVYNNLLTWITAGSSLVQANPYQESTMYTDNGHYVSMIIQTGWFKFAGMVGYQRIKQLAVLGEEYSPHYLNISLAFNYDTSGFSQTDQFDYSVLQWQSEQWGMFVNQQKCSSMTVQITDTQHPAGIFTGEGPSVSGLGINLGVKGGIFKLPIVQGG